MLYFILFKILNYVHVCGYVRLSVSACGGQRIALTPLVLEFAGGCELPYVGPGKWNLALHKRSQCS